MLGCYVGARLACVVGHEVLLRVLLVSVRAWVCLGVRLGVTEVEVGEWVFMMVVSHS